MTEVMERQSAGPRRAERLLRMTRRPDLAIHSGGVPVAQYLEMLSWLAPRLDTDRLDCLVCVTDRMSSRTGGENAPNLVLRHFQAVGGVRGGGPPLFVRTTREVMLLCCGRRLYGTRGRSCGSPLRPASAAEHSTLVVSHFDTSPLKRLETVLECLHQEYARPRVLPIRV